LYAEEFIHYSPAETVVILQTEPISACSGIQLCIKQVIVVGKELSLLM
jgi:hypothetical protein